MAKYVQLSDGRLIEFDDQASEDFMDRSVRSFLASEGSLQVKPEEEDEFRLVGDDPMKSLTEFGKAIPREFANTALSAASGLTELADSATNALGFEGAIDDNDNFIINAAQAGSDAISDSFLAADPEYQDVWTTKLGGAVGSFATFLGPGGAGMLLTRAGRPIAGSFAASTGTGIGVGSQAQEAKRRVDAAREQGIEVSQGQEDLSVALGGGVGFFETYAPYKILSKIDKRLAEPKFVNSATERIRSAIGSGTSEAVQEVAASLAQDAIERNVYNEDLVFDDSLASLLTSDDATLGFTVGFGADLLLNAATGRRNKLASEAEKQDESEKRENREEQKAKMRQAVSEYTPENPQPEPQPLLALPAPVVIERPVLDDEYIASIQSRNPTLSVDRITNEAFARTIEENLAQYNVFPESGKFVLTPDATAVAYIDKDGNSKTVTGPIPNLSDAQEVMTNLNDRIVQSQIRRNTVSVINNSGINYTPQQRSTLSMLGDRFINPQEDRYFGSKINQAAGTIGFEKYQEDLNALQAMKAKQENPDLEFTALQKLNIPRAKAWLKRAEAGGNVIPFGGGTKAGTYTDKLDWSVGQILDAGVLDQVQLGGLINNAQDRVLYQAVVGKRQLTSKDGTPIKNKDGKPVTKELKGLSNQYDAVIAKVNAETQEVIEYITTKPVTAQMVEERTQRKKPGEQLRRERVFSSLKEAKDVAKQLNQTEENVRDPSEKLFKTITPKDRTKAPRMGKLYDEAKKGAFDKTFPPGSAKGAADKYKFLNDILAEKNITNDVASPEIRVFIDKVLGTSSDPKIGDSSRYIMSNLRQDIGNINRERFRLLTGKLRSLPRFDQPTQIPLFSMEEARKQPPPPKTRSYKPQPLAAVGRVEAVENVATPEVKNNLNKLRKSLRAKLNKFGLKDILVGLDNSLQYAARDADNNLVFGVGAKAIGVDDQGTPIYKAFKRDAQDLKGNEEGMFLSAAESIMLGIDQAGLSGKTTEQQEEALLSILDHEALHAMRDLDLFTEKEWRILTETVTKKTNNQGVTYLAAAQRDYEELNLTGQVEEAVAELTRDELRGQRATSGKPRSLISRIKNFMVSVKNAINGLGFDSFRDVVGRVEAGQVGQRQRGQTRTLLQTEREKGFPAFETGPIREGAANIRPATVADEERLSDFVETDDPRFARRRSTSPIESAIELAKTKYAGERFSTEEEFFKVFWPRLLGEVKGPVTPNKMKLAARRSMRDINEFVKNNPKYSDFYTADMGATRLILEDRYGPISDEDFLRYRVYVGATSNGTQLKANVGDSVQLFDLYKREGSLDSIKMDVREGLDKNGNPIAPLVITESPITISNATANTKMRMIKNIDRLAEQMGSYTEAIEYLQTPITKKELQAFNREMGYKSPVTKVKDIEKLVNDATGQKELIPRMFIFGPKIGAFTQNLLGDQRYTTIDRWEARFVRSYIEGMFNKNLGLPKTVDEHDVFREFNQAFKKEYERIYNVKLEPSTMQAMRWYYIINAAREAGYTKAPTDETVSELTKSQIDRYFGEKRDDRRRESDEERFTQARAAVTQRGQESEFPLAAFIQDDPKFSKKQAAFRGAGDVAILRNQMDDDLEAAGVMRGELVSDLTQNPLSEDELNSMSRHGRALFKAMDKADFLGFDTIDDAFSAVFTEDLDNFDMPQGLKSALGTYVNKEYGGIQDDPTFSKRTVADRDVGPESVLKFKPYAPAQEAAIRYTADAGIDYTPPTKHVVANEERGKEIADEYDMMQHDPSNPTVQAAFKALKDESLIQYQYLLDTGLQVEFMGDTDPYDGLPSKALKDIEENNHLYVFPTKDGYGPATQRDELVALLDKPDTVFEYPMLEETEFTDINGEPMLANDVFRIVHDFFGHMKTGTTFRATGEENAWQNHASMFTPLARRALTTETRGQNSWVNFGPAAEQNKGAKVGDTVFAVQKTGLMPIWTSEENRESADARRRRFETDLRENTTGLQGAVDERGRIKLTHYAFDDLERSDPRKWGASRGLSRRGRSERQRIGRAPNRTYFGVEQGVQNRYRKEQGLGNRKHTAEVDASLLYDWNADKDGFYKGTQLQETRDHSAYEQAVKDSGYIGYFVDDPQIGMVTAVFDPLKLSVEGPTLKDQQARREIERQNYNKEFAAKQAEAKRQRISPIPNSKLEQVVEQNTREVENTNAGVVPKYSLKASPSAQYIARNPESARFVDKAKFSRNRRPDYDPTAQAEIDKLTADKMPDETPYDTYQDVTNGGPLGTQLTKFKAYWINKWARLEEYSQLPEFRKNLADTSAIAATMNADRSRGVTAATLRYGYVSYKGGMTKVEDFIHNGKTYRGLVEVMAPLFQNQYNVNLEQLAQAYAIAIRGKRLSQTKIKQGKKEKTIEVPSTEESLANLMPEINKYLNPETGRPIVVEWHEAWQAYNNQTIEFLKDTGVLDDKTAQDWANYSDYVPFYRQAEDPNVKDALPPVFKGMSGAGRFAQLRGGTTAINVPLLDAVTRNLGAAIDMGMKNVAQQRIVRDMVKIGQAREVKNGGGSNVIEFRVKGKVRRFQIDDPLLYESMSATGAGDAERTVAGVVAFPAKWLREFVTRDPGFMLVNMMRDTLSAYVTSGADFTPVADTFKNFTKGTQDLERYGVVGGYDFANDPDNIYTDFINEQNRRARKFTPLTMFKTVWDGLGAATTRSDAATRKAVYDDVLARTGNEAEAAYQALEVINFSRRGSSAAARILTAAIPFLNARFQGLDVLYRSVRGQYSANNQLSKAKRVQTFFTRAAYLTAISAAYWMLMHDEDEYKERSEFEKDNNYILPIKIDGRYPIKLPIPFEIGLLFKTLPERILDTFYGNTTKAELAESVQRGVGSTLMFNPLEAQIISPFMEVMMNKSFYTGNPIESVFMNDNNLQAGLRTKVNTSVLAQILGESLNVSPIMTDHVLKGYAGTLGGYVLQATDYILRETPQLVGEEKAVPRSTMTVAEMPLARKFIMSEFGTGFSEDFYDVASEVGRTVGTVNKLVESNDLERLQKFLVGREHLLGMRDSVNYVKKQLKSFRDDLVAIEGSDLPPEEKQRIKREIELNRQVFLRSTSHFKNVANKPVDFLTEDLYRD